MQYAVYHIIRQMVTIDGMTVRLAFNRIRCLRAQVENARKARETADDSRLDDNQI